MSDNKKVVATTTKKGKLLEVKSSNWTKEQIQLITRTVAKGATQDELALFLYTANKVGLDPLAKQIYFMKHKLKDGVEQMTIITGIDGFRAIAERAKDYAGQDDVIFDGGKVYEKEPENPEKATVTVYRIKNGERVAFTATARWKEYKPAPPKDFMWKKMPYLMLGKVAEGLALRKAFPNDLSGLYIQDEMDRSVSYEKPDREVIEATPLVVEPKKIEPEFACEECHKEVVSPVANFSQKRYKKVLCTDCQEQLIIKNKKDEDSNKTL